VIDYRSWVCYLWVQIFMRFVLATMGLLILALVLSLVAPSCEKPASSGGPPDDTDTTANVDIQGEYYGYLTTDYYTLNRRTVSRIHINVTHSSGERNGCPCVYDIAVADSIATIALICADGKSSRLTADCNDNLYHDIFVGSGNGSKVSGIIERYKVQSPGPEIHFCTMSFDAELP